MALQPFTNEQLNYFKFAFVVLNEFPKALRQTFTIMWDNTYGHRPGFQLWDDSIAVRNMFLATEGGSTKVPTHLSCNDWDCTALFQATIFARSFSLPDGSGHQRTLSYLYVKPHGVPAGGFHASVISPSGNSSETLAMAIDQLRLLRNAFCHSSSSKIAKPTFDQYIQYTKDAFQALGVTSGSVDAIGSLTEADFPTERVRKLEDDIKKELQVDNTFLKEQVKDELIGIRSGIAHATQELQNDAERAAKERKEETQELKNQLQLKTEELKEETLELKRTIRSDIAYSNQARLEDAKQAATKRKEEIQDLKNQLELHHEELIKETLERMNQAREEDSTRAARERKQEIQQLKQQLELATSAAASQEINEKLAELNRRLDDIGSLTEADFPTERVRKLEDDIKKELQVYEKFLNEQVKDELIGIRSDIAQATQKIQDDAERAAKERKEETQLKTEELKEKTLELKRTIRSDIAYLNQVRVEDATRTAREIKKEIQELKQQSELATSAAASQEINEKLAELNRRLDDIAMKTTKQGISAFCFCIRNYLF